MIMKKVIPEAFKGWMTEKTTTAKEFPAQIEQLFVKNEKDEICMLLTNLILVRYTGKGNIKEYIMEMSHVSSKLRAFKFELSQHLLVHLVFNNLTNTV